MLEERKFSFKQTHLAGKGGIQLNNFMLILFLKYIQYCFYLYLKERSFHILKELALGKGILFGPSFSFSEFVRHDVVIINVIFSIDNHLVPLNVGFFIILSQIFFCLVQIRPSFIWRNPIFYRSWCVLDIFAFSLSPQ